MTRAPRLKVFRTPIGFHDAYVAAPSRAAALRAWGADRNLFARGIAEEVTDSVLTAEPLARPGEVVKRSRGTVAEQIAALPPSRPKCAKSARDNALEPALKPVRLPKPDRSALDQAEIAIANAEARRSRAERDLVEREAALAWERRTLELTCEDELAGLDRARRRAARAYDQAMAAWRAGSA